MNFRSISHSRGHIDESIIVKFYQLVNLELQNWEVKLMKILAKIWIGNSSTLSRHNSELMTESLSVTLPKIQESEQRKDTIPPKMQLFHVAPYCDIPYPSAVLSNQFMHWKKNDKGLCLRWIKAQNSTELYSLNNFSFKATFIHL